jgi:hypothetical protein
LKDFFFNLPNTLSFFIIFFWDLGTDPGMGFRPMPSRVTEGSLIWYNLSNKTQINQYVESLDKFLESKNQF